MPSRRAAPRTHLQPFGQLLLVARHRRPARSKLSSQLLHPHARNGQRRARSIRAAQGLRIDMHAVDDDGSWSRKGRVLSAIPSCCHCRCRGIGGIQKGLMLIGQIAVIPGLQTTGLGQASQLCSCQPTLLHASRVIQTPLHPGPQDCASVLVCGHGVGRNGPALAGHGRHQLIQLCGQVCLAAGGQHRRGKRDGRLFDARPQLASACKHRSAGSTSVVPPPTSAPAAVGPADHHRRLAVGWHCDAAAPGRPGSQAAPQWRKMREAGNVTP